MKKRRADTADFVPIYCKIHRTKLLMRVAPETAGRIEIPCSQCEDLRLIKITSKIENKVEMPDVTVV